MGGEKELLRLVDALPGVVLAGQADGNVDFLNRGWEHYTGLNAAGGVGLGWQAAVHPEDLLKLAECTRSIVETGRTGEAEARLRRRDGAYLWFLFRASLVVELPAAKWCGYFMDIDERKQIVDGLRIREAQYSSIADSIPALIAVMSPTGEVESVNRHVLEYFGMKVEDLRSWTTVGAVYPDDLPAVIAAWTKSVQTEEPYEIEHRMRRFDGVYRWFHVRALPLKDAEGRVTRWHCLQTDIDGRKRAEAMLAEEKRLLELIATGGSLSTALTELCGFAEDLCPACAPCAILLIDREGRPLLRAASSHFPKALFDSIEDFAIYPTADPLEVLRGGHIASSISEKWRREFVKVASPLGVKSCFIIPNTSSANDVSGRFAIFAVRPSDPEPEDQEVITRIVHLASIAIEREYSQSSLARAHDELKQSEGRLRTIIDTSPGMVWSTAPDGSVEFLNRQWLEFAGVRLEEVSGLGWQAVIHPDDASKLFVYWQTLLETGQPGETDARMRRFDGTYRWFLMRAAPLRNEAGQIAQWFGQNTDIDDLKQAEALLEGEKRLLEMIAGGYSITRLLVELCHFVEGVATGCLCSVMLVDAAGVHFEQGAAPSLPLGFVTSSLGRLVKEEASPCAMAAYLNRQVVATDLASESQWDASWSSMALARGLRSCWGAPISSADGQMLGAFAIYYGEPRSPGAVHQSHVERVLQVARIAIERSKGDAAIRSSKENLAASERNLRLIINTMPGLAAAARPDGGWEFLNQAYQDYMGISSEQAERLTWDYPVHPDDVEAQIRMGITAATTGVVGEAEVRLRRFDGVYRWFLHRTAPLRDESGMIVKWVGFHIDIDDRKRTEEELRNTQAKLMRMERILTMGQLAASIAHEVNSPLSGIITNAGTCLRMLAANPPNIEGARATVQRTVRDGNRASEVIKRLRALFNSKDMAVEPFDLNEATREVIALSVNRLQSSQVVLHTKLSENLPRLIGDRVQLQQVVLNLLQNAADAMSAVEDRPRQMAITTERDGREFVRLTVRDAGTGFALEDSQKLFEPFYTTKGDGMGIGLSISRSIVERHGGRIWAVVNEGAGASFTFSIPISSSGSSVGDLSGNSRAGVTVHDVK